MVFLYIISHRIDKDFVIKVADFGLSEDIYCKNYFLQGQGEEGSPVKLPIKGCPYRKYPGWHLRRKDRCGKCKLIYSYTYELQHDVLLLKPAVALWQF